MMGLNMADGTEDVLELDTPLEGGDEDQQTDGEQPETGEDGEDGDEPEIPTFDPGEGEEAAPASEESSVIRDLRNRVRELNQRLRVTEKTEAPKQIEVGPEPTLETCGFDGEELKAELRKWDARKAQAEAQARAEAEKAEEARKAWQARVETYETRKAALKVPDFDAAEEEVRTTLPEQTLALLMLNGKSAEIVYALSQSPAKLKQLSDLNLAEAAMMIGELGATVQMKKRAPLPSPDRGLRGNARLSGSAATDKHLANLKAKAQATGDYTEYLAAKRASG
jgi:hypothetical protein